MKNILMLTFADLRKNKSQAVSLLVFVLIAAMLLGIGFVMLFGLGNLFDERAELNNAAHFTGIYDSHSDSIDEGLRFIEAYPGVAETEVLNVIGGFGEYFIGDTGNPSLMFLSQVSREQRMDAPSMVGEYLPLSGDMIYIPYFMMLSGGYEIGDDFRLDLSGVELNFSVAGATEEIMFGSQFNSMHRFYVSDERYEELQTQFPENGITLLSVRLENSDDEIFFYEDYIKSVSSEGLYFAFTYQGSAKGPRLMIPNIAAIIVTVFALILLGVSLIVMRFRITNSIEESMTNIGAQKAIGYRSVQIVSSIVMQFILIALIGGVAGAVLAQITIPLIMGILEPMTALVWTRGFDVSVAVASLLLVLVTVSLISFVSARRINKLHPLIALRGGSATHSFKKNTLPLDKARGPLDLLIAIKLLAQKKKQAAAICVIVAVVTMASVAGIAAGYNMTEEWEGFARAFFGEPSDVSFMLSSGNDGEAFKERMLSRPEVRKAFGYEVGVLVIVDDTSILATIVEDTSLLEGSMLISGRYPRHNNEIALGPSILRVADKGIGDTVLVKSGEMEKEYLVTGVVQFMQNNGFNGMMIGDALREIQPGYEFLGYNVYLDEGTDISAFVESVRAAEGDIFDSVMEVWSVMKTTIEGFGGIFALVAIGIVAVTAFVVILVLYIVIKTTILHRRRELGIQKALGFTTLQLMNQIALNMTPVILIGVLLGAVAGYFGLNPMMAAVMSGMGIVSVNLPVPIDQTVIVSIALVALAYGVSMLIARRIRKISAYALVTE